MVSLTALPAAPVVWFTVLPAAPAALGAFVPAPDAFAPDPPFEGVLFASDDGVGARPAALGAELPRAGARVRARVERPVVTDRFGAAVVRAAVEVVAPAPGRCAAAGVAAAGFGAAVGVFEVPCVVATPAPTPATATAAATAAALIHPLIGSACWLATVDSFEPPYRRSHRHPRDRTSA